MALIVLGIKIDAIGSGVLDRALIVQFFSPRQVRHMCAADVLASWPSVFVLFWGFLYSFRFTEGFQSIRMNY